MFDNIVQWLLAPILAAMIASSLTLSRVKREKRWEATREAYIKILTALHDIHFWADDTYASLRFLPSVGKEKRESLRRRYDDAKHELWAYVNVGLTISTPAQRQLEELLAEISKEEFRFEDDPVSEDDYSDALVDHCDKLRKMIDAALPSLVATARTELK